MTGNRLRAALVTATVVGLAGSFAGTAPASGAAERGTFIVVMNSQGDAASAERRATGLGGQVTFSYRHALNGFAVNLPTRAASALSSVPGVQYVEADGPVSIVNTQSGATWGLDRIDQRDLPLNNSYSYSSGASGVKAYVVDTGVKADHQEFGDRVVSGFSAFNDGDGRIDGNGHGTHVAGTIAGAVYGVAKAATIVPVRVLDDKGSGAISGVIAGLDYIAKTHMSSDAAVANMSLGGGASTALDDAVRRVIAAGVTVVVAAGNSNADACRNSPARVAEALTIGATTSTDARASYSNFGTCLDLFAPGSAITSAWPTSTTATNTISGTSMAAPHVAGAVALHLAGATSATPAAVAAAITQAATPNKVGSPGKGSPNLLLFVPQSASATPIVSNPPPSETTATAPAAASNVTATAGKRSAKVEWTLGSNGGSAITGSTVHAFQEGTFIGTVNVSGTTRTVTIGGLRAGSSYSFSVIVHNSVGSSPESARSNSVIVLR
jgi:subtilisin family serine protease